jgi:hypothetical protein
VVPRAPRQSGGAQSAFDLATIARCPGAQRCHSSMPGCPAWIFPRREGPQTKFGRTVQRGAAFFEKSAPDRIRTCDLMLRRALPCADLHRSPRICADSFAVRADSEAPATGRCVPHPLARGHRSRMRVIGAFQRIPADPGVFPDRRWPSGRLAARGAHQGCPNMRMSEHKTWRPQSSVMVTRTGAACLHGRWHACPPVLR